MYSKKWSITRVTIPVVDYLHVVDHFLEKHKNECF